MADISWRANPWVWVVSFKVLSTTGRPGIGAVERPMLFSTDMVEALLDGRKTMTRRVLTPQIISNDGWYNWINESNRKISLVQWLSKEDFLKQVVTCCPYGKPGDILWVRETWAKVHHSSYRQSNGVIQMPLDDIYVAVFKAGWSTCTPSWKPSIHMPKVAARIWLQITDVRLELLQDTSESDAAAEGVAFRDDMHTRRIYRDYLTPNTPWLHSRNGRPFTAVDSFQSLWESINNKKGASHG